MIPAHSALWDQLTGPQQCDMRQVARAFAADTGSDGAVIQISDGMALTVLGAWPGDEHAEARLVVPVGNGVTGLVARNGHAMRLGADSPRGILLRRLLGIEDGGEVARLCIPTRGVGGRILGVVGLHRSVERPYTDEETTALEPYADLLGLRMQVGELSTLVDVHRNDRDRLMVEAVSAQEAERRRIASDLHDGVATALASMSFHLSAAELSMSDAADGAADSEALAQAKAQIETARRLADLAYGQTRAAITGLHSLVLDDLGLVAAVESWIEMVHGARVVLVADPAEEFEGVAEHLSATLFRMIQESVSNATRHAQATTVTVRLERRGALVVLRVSDDGVGFDVRQAPARRDRDSSEGHYGLSSLAERAALVGATLRIDSAPGQGTTVIVELPLIEAPPPTG